MKILHLVLISSLMLMFAVHPAQAKAGERYGFVPLVTQANPNTPLEIQAQQAFETLLPKLNAAQKSGDILEFEPEFSAGVLKIRYAADTGMTASNFTDMQEFNDIKAAVAQVPVQQSTAFTNDTITTTALTPNFRVKVYGSCFWGSGMEADSRVSSSLYNKTGKLISNTNDKVGLDNRMFGCFPWTGNFSNIEPGNKAIYRIYSPIDDTLLRTLTITVPSITMDNTNHASSVVAGTGPANKPYSLQWTHIELAEDTTYSFFSASGTISKQRNFLADFNTKTLLHGRDVLKLEVKQNANFSFYIETNVRFASCELNVNYCRMRAFPNELVSAKIMHAGKPYLFTERASSWGDVEFNLQDAQNNPLNLVPGDSLEATGIPLYILPKITASVDFDNDKVQGAIPANSYFSIWADDSINYGSLWAHAKPTTAYYSVDFTSQFDFQQKNGVRVLIQHIDAKTGHTTSCDFVFAE